jgi:hypothetical protein
MYLVACIISKKLISSIKSCFYCLFISEFVVIDVLKYTVVDVHNRMQDTSTKIKAICFTHGEFCQNGVYDYTFYIAFCQIALDVHVLLNKLY